MCIRDRLSIVLLLLLLLLLPELFHSLSQLLVHSLCLRDLKSDFGCFAVDPVTLSDNEPDHLLVWGNLHLKLLIRCLIVLRVKRLPNHIIEVILELESKHVVHVGHTTYLSDSFATKAKIVLRGCLAPVGRRGVPCVVKVVFESESVAVVVLWAMLGAHQPADLCELEVVEFLLGQPIEVLV